MFLELIATFAIGFATAGITHLVNRLTGRRLPRWLIPVSAGIAMIAFTIFNEYSWFQRTSNALPQGLIVVKSAEHKVAYRPWTYVKPYVDRFIALDMLSMRRNEKLPDMRIIDMLIYGRWTPAQRIRAAFNCKSGQRADLLDGVTFNDDGSLEGATWHNTGLDDPMTKAACKEA